MKEFCGEISSQWVWNKKLNVFLVVAALVLATTTNGVPFFPTFDMSLSIHVPLKSRTGFAELINQFGS